MQRIRRWASLAALALMGAAALSAWLSTPLGFLLFAAAVWVFLTSVAHCIAAASRNLLDPYRARESWEPRDWWNH